MLFSDSFPFAANSFELKFTFEFDFELEFEFELWWRLELCFAEMFEFIRIKFGWEWEWDRRQLGEEVGTALNCSFSGECMWEANEASDIW